MSQKLQAQQILEKVQNGLLTVKCLVLANLVLKMLQVMCVPLQLFNNNTHYNRSSNNNSSSSSNNNNNNNNKQQQQHLLASDRKTVNQHFQNFGFIKHLKFIVNFVINSSNQSKQPDQSIYVTSQLPIFVAGKIDKLYYLPVLNALASAIVSGIFCLLVSGR